MLWSSWPAVLSCAVAAVAALIDLRTGRIPNLLTLPAAAAAPLVHGLVGGWPAAAHALLGAGICFLPGLLLFSRGAVGGGDVKLFAALGALLGPGPGLQVQLLSFGAVAVYALWATAWHGQLWALLRSSARASLRLLFPKRFAHLAAQGELSVAVRMGPAILLAVGATALGVHL